MFTINAQSIQKMMHAHTPKQSVPFSYESLRETYQRIDFSSRAKTLQHFMETNAPMPIKNPPYPTSTFPERTKKIVIVLSYLLGYHSDQ